MYPRAHAFACVCQRLKINVCREIDQAGRQQRLGELMTSDGLQRIPDRALCVAIVDDQRGSAAARDASADLERDVVGTPLEDLADLGCAQPPWQKLVEQRDRITIDAEM